MRIFKVVWRKLNLNGFCQCTAYDDGVIDYTIVFSKVLNILFIYVSQIAGSNNWYNGLFDENENFKGKYFT